jgi:hypothetical protein
MKDARAKLQDEWTPNLDRILAENYIRNWEPPPDPYEHSLEKEEILEKTGWVKRSCAGWKICGYWSQTLKLVATDPSWLDGGRSWIICWGRDGQLMKTSDGQ